MVEEPNAIVVGGGPAGLIAAEVLAGDGLAVNVYEHRRSVGRTLLLAGRSGLNLTHAEPRDAFVARYDTPSWVEPFLGEFGPAELREWAAWLGQSTFVGSTGRVFPDAQRATPLLRSWTARLRSLGVGFETGHRWLGWTSDGEGHRFRRSEGSEPTVFSDATVLALGGASWPHVGGDGGWVDAFATAGIRVEPLVSSNAGVLVAWSTAFGERFAGSPLKNVAVTLDDLTVRGDVTVTSQGLESGPIYTLGPRLRRAFAERGRARLMVDLHPDQEAARIVARLERRRAKDSTSNWLRRSLGLDPVAVNLLREVAPSGRSPTELDELAALIKAVPVDVDALEPIDRAISTAGGVALDELTDDLMVRRRPGSFVAGEMIDWDAPTGGYLLQACFSTGVAAARGASNWSRVRRDRSPSLTDDVR